MSLYRNVIGRQVGKHAP